MKGNIENKKHKLCPASSVLMSGVIDVCRHFRQLCCPSDTEHRKYTDWFFITRYLKDELFLAGGVVVTSALLVYLLSLHEITW